MKNTESSVLANLKDIFEMEADRRASEAAAKERAKAEAAARAEAERVARERELETARAEERKLAEAERAARDLALDARIASLKDELAQVRAEREDMRLKVADRIMNPEPARASKGSWIAGMMAAASLVAAITATAVAWPREGGEQLAQLEPTVQLEPALEPTVEPEPTAVEPVVAQPEPEPVAVVEQPRTPRTPRTPRQPREQRDTLSNQLDFDMNDTDVLGDLDD
jgi:hypothetical protein